MWWLTHGAITQPSRLIGTVAASQMPMICRGRYWGRSSAVDVTVWRVVVLLGRGNHGDQLSSIWWRCDRRWVVEQCVRPYGGDDRLDLSQHQLWLLVLDVVVAPGGDDVTAAGLEGRQLVLQPRPEPLLRRRPASRPGRFLARRRRD